MKIISINKNRDFKKIYVRGKSFAETFLVMYFIKNNLKINRLGITVSKKIGNSVKRNRVKRRIKAVYILNSNNIKVGYDIVLIGRNKTNTAKFSEIEKCFWHILKRNNLFLEKMVN
ncbi:MAG: ribonuclease P protein component [Clostridiales bacterium]|jgi:ribonuclease P protein component|nr:ribonuclease P protein component [Clostridiales bacterium]